MTLAIRCQVNYDTLDHAESEYVGEKIWAKMFDGQNTWPVYCLAPFLGFSSGSNTQRALLLEHTYGEIHVERYFSNSIASE